MSELQYRLWCSKMILIEHFYKTGADFNGVATALEPPLDAAPIKDIRLLNEWYDLWGPLEDTNAYNLSEGIETKVEDVKNQLEKLRQFFVDNMEKVRALKEGDIT